MIPTQTQTTETTETTETTQDTTEQPRRINLRSAAAVGAAVVGVAGMGVATQAVMEANTPNVPMVRPDAHVLVTDGVVHTLPENPADLQFALKGGEVVVDPQTTTTTAPTGPND